MKAYIQKARVLRVWTPPFFFIFRQNLGCERENHQDCTAPMPLHPLVFFAAQLPHTSFYRTFIQTSQYFVLYTLQIEGEMSSFAHFCCEWFFLPFTHFCHNLRTFSDNLVLFKRQSPPICLLFGCMLESKFVPL